LVRGVAGAVNTLLRQSVRAQIPLRQKNGVNACVERYALLPPAIHAELGRIHAELGLALLLDVPL
jgi:hypothetical protein